MEDSRVRKKFLAGSGTEAVERGAASFVDGVDVCAVGDEQLGGCLVLEYAAVVQGVFMKQLVALMSAPLSSRS